MSLHERFTTAHAKNRPVELSPELKKVNDTLENFAAQLPALLQARLEQMERAEVEAYEESAYARNSGIFEGRDSLKDSDIKNLPGFKKLHDFCSRPDIDIRLDIRVEKGNFGDTVEKGYTYVLARVNPLKPYARRPLKPTNAP